MPKRLLTLAFTAALLAVACGKIPQGTMSAGAGNRFIPEVADHLDNAGLGSQVVVDKDGVPYVSYLIVPAVLKAGAIPIARPIGAPYITVPPSGDTKAQSGAAIGIASMAENGIWTRGAAAQVPNPNATSIAVPYGPTTEASLIGATSTNTNGTGIAVDDSGGLHVVWTGDDGVYYAEAPSTGGFTVEEIFKYGSTLAVVGPMSRPSVAVAGDGTPWVAYSVMSGDRVEVHVATKDAGGTWVTTTVATSASCNGCPPPRIPRIGVTPDGPIVAWVDAASASIEVARLKDGTWTTATVGSGANPYGLALAVGKDGSVFITYYAGNTVMMASSVSSGWTVAKVADATPPTPSPTPSATPSPSPAASGSPTPTASPAPPLPDPTAGNFEPTTGVAVDEKGKVYVTWTDGETDKVWLSSSDDGTKFTPVQTQDTQRGAYPSVAVKADGSAVYLTWYDEENQDLRMGILSDIPSLAIAVPSPTPPPGSAPPTTGPACGADGKIALDETAQGTAFLDKCLVAPAGKDFSIIFDDKDVAATTGQHNIAIATDTAGTKLIFTGDLVTGPDKVTYDVTAKSGPLDAGTYYFHCQVHPTMTGVLAVVKVK